MRVFEALACGSLLLTNDRRTPGRLTCSGRPTWPPTDARRLLDKLPLPGPAGRPGWVERPRAEAVARHTYRHRMQRLCPPPNRFRLLPVPCRIPNPRPAAP